MVAEHELVHLAPLRAKIARDYGTRHPFYKEMSALADEVEALQTELAQLKTDSAAQIAALCRENETIKAALARFEGGLQQLVRDARVEIAACRMSEEAKVIVPAHTNGSRP